MIGDTLHEFRSVSSTNDLARSAVEHDVAEGTVYMADHQTKGRGRRGATWIDEAGLNVLMTVVLYPTTPISVSWRIGWAASVAIVDALSSFEVAAKCKWPNDVVVDGKKIAGTLVETVLRQDSSYAALVGIGINVAQAVFDESVSYRITPTSIALTLKKGIPTVLQVADRVCQSLNLVYSGGSVLWPETSGWYRENLLIGEPQSAIEVTSGSIVSGVLTDVRDSDGAALIVASDGFRYFGFPDDGAVA